MDQDPKLDRTIDRILASLKREYVIMNSVHVRAWQAWLVVGLMAGILIGIVLVANRSGGVEPTHAEELSTSIINVVSPNGGEVLGLGSTITIRWNGGQSAYKVRVLLTKDSPYPKLTPPVLTIANYISNTGSSTWTIPANLTAGQYRIRACFLLNATGVCLGADTSDGPFSIVTPTKISSCGTINHGGVYAIDQDVMGQGNGCLTIQNVNGFSLDCGGHAFILDELSQPLTEVRKPLLGVQNTSNFSINACTFRVVNPPPVGISSVEIASSTAGTISNSIFYDSSAPSSVRYDPFISISYTSNLHFVGNTVYTVMVNGYSNNNIIENNSFLPPLQLLEQATNPITSTGGDHNTIRNNWMDGKWDGQSNVGTGLPPVGSDDGIVLLGESNDLIEQNTISNNYDCGIETGGLIQNTVIRGNTITNSGECGIGAWYGNSWKNNTVDSNTISGGPVMFLFFRADDLRPGETNVYFTNNIFRNNTFLNPTHPTPQYYPAQFAFRSTFITANNTFTGNNFTTTMRAPVFTPVSLVIDGGGNICGAPSSADYPNGDFPLHCN